MRTLFSPKKWHPLMCSNSDAHQLKQGLLVAACRESICFLGSKDKSGSHYLQSVICLPPTRGPCRSTPIDSSRQHKSRDPLRVYCKNVGRQRAVSSCPPARPPSVVHLQICCRNGRVARVQNNRSNLHLLCSLGRSRQSSQAEPVA